MRSILAVGIAILVLGAATARAQQPAAGSAEDRSAQAKQHYETGMAHFQLEEWDDAIKEWEAGFRLKPVPQFLYNIAQAYRLSKRPEKALSFYQKYLRLDPKAANKAEVDHHIALLTKIVEDQKKSTSAPPTAPMPAETEQQPKPGTKGMMVINRSNTPVATTTNPTTSTTSTSTSTTSTSTTNTTLSTNNRIAIVRDPVLINRLPTENNPPTNTTNNPPTNTTNNPPTTDNTTTSTTSTSGTATTTAPTDNTPFYKKAWFWGVIGGGVVAIIGAIVAGVLVPGSSDNTKILPMAHF
jgi:hypothetical protein